MKVTVPIPVDDLLLLSCSQKQRSMLYDFVVAFILLRMRRDMLFKWS